MNPNFMIARLPRSIFSAILLLLIVCPLTYAQDMTATDVHHGLVSLGLTSDAFGAMEMGYAHDIPSSKQLSALYYVRFSIPVILAIKTKAVNAWEINAGVQSGLLTREKFSTRGEFRISFSRHKQILGHFMPMTLNIGLTPCYNIPKGYIGLQASWNQVLWTHISHSQYVQNSYQDITDAEGNILTVHPRDGWYTGTGSYVNIGIEGYRQMSQKIAIYAELGLTKYSSLYSGIFDAMMIGQIPFYSNLRLFYSM